MRRPVLLVLLVLACLVTLRTARADGDPDAQGALLSAESLESLPDPPTPEIAYQELLRNSEALGQLRQLIAQRNQATADTGQRYQEQRKVLEGALLSLSGAAGKCLPTGPTPAQKKLLEDARQALLALDRVVKGDPRQYQSRFDARLLCDPKEGPAALSDEQNKALLEGITGMRERWVQLTQQQVQAAEKLALAREQRHKRLSEVSARLQREKSSTANIVTDLKWLVIILCFLSVSVLLVVRSYSPDLQTEWVSSGQVIQYMTVLVILIAVLALGLSGVLKENTLGTLLGGIGGYVLSQGVGRAVARNAVRQAQREPSTEPRAPR